MSRKARAAAPSRLEALLASGDHRAAAREARGVLADAGAPPERRAQAGAVLTSLAPEPLALLLGLAGAGVSIALAIWASLGGAR